MKRIITTRKLFLGAVWALPAVMIFATAALTIIADGLDPLNFLILTITISIPFYAVGALIVSHHPRQSVGWIMWLIGAVSVLELWLECYGQASLSWGQLPGAATARAISEPFWIPSVILPVTLLPLLFPTGTPLSRRWRWFGWLAVMAMLVMVGPPTFFFWIHRQALVTNPQVPMPAAVDATFPIGAVGVLISASASFISVIVRFRRSSGIERQQIKWFLAGVATALAGVAALQFAPWRPDVDGAAIMALPFTVGVAILRYRLFEIDRIINKTLVYGAVTLFLAGLDLLLVFGFEHLLAPVASSSSLIVAGSTLAVAALVQPLRSRIQTTVDRRFYRHKYDAVRTLEALSARLRDQTDLDALATELGSVVHETMQPEHVSLWLRDAGRRGTV